MLTPAEALLYVSQTLVSASPWHKALLMLILGVTAHRSMFIYGEWHMQAPRLFLASLISPAMIFVLHLISESPQAAFFSTALMTTTFFTGLFGSILIYRALFHPLREFPGPRLARLSKMWHMYQSRAAKNHLLLQRLHSQYGPVVRTGPNELSIVDPDIYNVINGPGNKCTKSAWYDFSQPETGLTNTRDIRAHDARRKVWSTALGPRLMTQYEAKVIEFADLLEQRVASVASTGQTIDANTLFYFFTFDVMGSFTLSRDFGMLKSNQWHHAVEMLRKGLKMVGPVSPVPWLVQLLNAFGKLVPGVEEFQALKKFCRDCMAEREKNADDSKQDVAAALIRVGGGHAMTAHDRAMLDGDALSFIIAGSDTTASALIMVFYELCKQPQYQRLIHEEVRSLRVDDKERLAKAPHLNAFIMEVLRLHPGVPTHGLRDAPPEGLNFKGTYIPGQVTIYSPSYVMQRLERHFEDAASFIPERWTTRPEMVRDRKAYAPFGQGKTLCLGQTLAYSEMRVAITVLLSRYRVRFAAAEDALRVERDMGDHFTLAPGQMNLIFERR